MILTFPIILLCSLVIVFALRSSPFVLQDRGLTLSRHRFTIYNLRTLKKDTHEDAPEGSHADILNRSFLSPSVPRFCGWLRRTGIDELPQLLNILLGDMAFIGPRPLILSDLDEIKNDYPEYYQIRDNLKSKPGISGLWQIYGDRSGGVKNLVEMDQLYEQKKSFFLDLKLIFNSIPIILFAEHADAIVGRRRRSLPDPDGRKTEASQMRKHTCKQ
jgi:undecaprenyl-phosphate galactose phosphotransferase